MATMTMLQPSLALPSFKELDQRLGTADRFPLQLPTPSLTSVASSPRNEGPTTPKCMTESQAYFDAATRTCPANVERCASRRNSLWLQDHIHAPRSRSMSPSQNDQHRVTKQRPARPSRLMTDSIYVQSSFGQLSPTYETQDLDLANELPGAWCDDALDAVRHLRKPSARLLHKDAENFRRKFHASMLSGLRESSIDVANELDANRIEQFERFLPLELIREKDALNNKRGDTKNLSFIAALIKIMSLKETIRKQRLMIKKLDVQARHHSRRQSASSARHFHASLWRETLPEQHLAPHRESNYDGQRRPQTPVMLRTPPMSSTSSESWSPR